MGELETELIGNRYRLLDKLGAGGMGVVYRAFDRLSRQSVALKRVLKPSSELDIGGERSAGTTFTQIALAHEFQMLASLRHPYIISVLDYGFDALHQPYFTMTFLENARTIIEAGRSKPEKDKVKLLIEMLQALVYLHRRGIIHRDLKPDNALVTADEQVRVLDFGISVKREQVSKNASDTISGTLAYMAPEVLQGIQASEASDLYSVGMIAYEMFAGHHPYDLNNANQLVMNIMLKEADLSELKASPDIVSILQMLLQKTPENRYQDANEVIDFLSEAINQPIPQETAAIRESFLQAAKFVGRNKEQDQLTAALAQTMDKHGSAWLIGGESGVGKSRLLDEVRTQALVKGALVLQGQAIAEGGFSYHLWREPLRRLALSTELSDLDASVLKQIVTGIGDLLERDIPDAPELAGKAGQGRLVTTIANVFRAQTQPIVLILEDLHWSSESLEVLQQLSSLTSELSLLIIGSYRNDEKPDLPKDLPDMKVIKLERLNEEAIAELSKSMLGEAGNQPQVLDLLNKETEGNVFFLVEVVRTLAEEAGWLSSIGSMSLPRNVFAGGIQQIVKRRLDRVAEDCRPLLRIAAIAGRQLDLGLLRALSKNVDVEAWLTQCANAGVLDIMDEKWRFAHDKLREGVLSGLSPDELKAANLEIAEALETLYAAAGNEYAAKISDHFEQAGEFSRAADWHARAGKHAEATYATDTAIEYYQKALAYWKQNSDAGSQPNPAQLEAYLGLGEMLNWKARYAESTELWTTIRADAEKRGDQLALARAWRGLGVIQMYQGNFPDALELLAHSEEAAKLSNAQVELTKILQLRGWCQFNLGNMDSASVLAEQALTMSEEDKDRQQIGEVLNLLTAIHGTQGHFEQAAQECQRALAIFQEIGARSDAMFQGGNLALIAGMRGDYRAALEHFKVTLRLARELGRRDAEMLYLNNIGGEQVKLGEYLEAEQTLSQVIQMSETTPFRQLGESYCHLANATLGLDKVQLALDYAQRGLDLGRTNKANDVIVWAWRAFGKIAAYQGQQVSVLNSDLQQTSFTAEACFAESDRVCRESGMEGERALTLRAWATYELEQGNAARGDELWLEARGIFRRLGAHMEVARMTELPKKAGG